MGKEFIGPKFVCSKAQPAAESTWALQVNFYNDDENADCRKSLMVIGGRKGEIDIPDRSMDVLQHRNAKYVQVFINTLTQPSKDVLQHCCGALHFNMTKLRCSLTF